MVPHTPVLNKGGKRGKKPKVSEESQQDLNKDIQIERQRAAEQSQRISPQGQDDGFGYTITDPQNNYDGTHGSGMPSNPQLKSQPKQEGFFKAQADDPSQESGQASLSAVVVGEDDNLLGQTKVGTAGIDMEQ